MTTSARVTSIGVGFCVGHSGAIPMIGTVVTGSPNVIINNLAAARVTDIVLGYCGHIGIIVDGFGSIKVNNLTKARVGSNFVGIFSGVITTGYSGVNVG